MGGGEASGQEGSCPDPAGGTQCRAEPALGAGTGQNLAVGMLAPKSQLPKAGRGQEHKQRKPAIAGTGAWGFQDQVPGSAGSLIQKGEGL